MEGGEGNGGGWMYLVLSTVTLGGLIRVENARGGFLHFISSFSTSTSNITFAMENYC